MLITAMLIMLCGVPATLVLAACMQASRAGRMEDAQKPPAR